MIGVEKIIELITRKGIDYKLGIIRNGYFIESNKVSSNVINVKIKENYVERFIDYISKQGFLLKPISKNKYIELLQVDNSEYYLLINFVINSHIQIPKSILKYFLTGCNLYYIDTEINKIKRSSSRKYNTSLGYYSLYFEEHLNENYETVLGNITKKILSFYEGDNRFLTLENIYDDIEKLFKMSLFRNPKFIEDVNNKSALSFLVSGGYNHEYIAFISEQENINILKDMRIFIILNKTTCGLVTLKSLFSNIVIQGYECMIFVINPKFAILIVPKKYYEEKIGLYSDRCYIKIEEEKVLKTINESIYNYCSIYKENVIGQKSDLESILNEREVDK